MRRRLAALGLFLAASACSPSIEGVDEARLTETVGSAIGDPNTCVMIVNPDGDVLWQFGNYITCGRQLPACDEGGHVMTAKDLAKAAAGGYETAVSCPSRADGSADVAWASGRVEATEGAAHGPLAYAAVMEGERALPGREIKLRLERALRQAGL